MTQAVVSARCIHADSGVGNIRANVVSVCAFVVVNTVVIAVQGETCNGILIQYDTIDE